MKFLPRVVNPRNLRRLPIGAQVFNLPYRRSTSMSVGMTRGMARRRACGNQRAARLRWRIELPLQPSGQFSDPRAVFEIRKQKRPSSAHFASVSIHHLE